MDILITGGAGFIGTHLTNKLLQLNHKITILDNLLPQVHGENKKYNNKSVNFIKGDVRNKKDWNKAFENNVDVVIHLAAETGTYQSMQEIEKCVSTNINGTALLVEYLKNNKTNVKKVILTSSRAVYGESPNASESLTPNPKSIYALTKQTQEQILLISLKDIPLTILRLQNVYGPEQSLNNPYTGIVSIFTKKFLQNINVEIFDNGKAIRDFIYIDDVVDAILISIEERKTNHKIYNVGSAKKTSVLEVAKEIKNNIKNSESKIIITNFHREGDVMSAYANIDKIKKELKWEPKVNLKTGIKHFVEWSKV